MDKTVLLLALILVVSGCAQNQYSAAQGQELSTPMPADMITEADKISGGVGNMDVVANGDTVKVEYVGTFPDTNEVFDKSEGRGPLEFVVGAGQMIKGFDSAVLGMKLNGEKTVTIPPEEAYGTLEDAQIVEVPLEQIQGDAETTVGTIVYSSSGMRGTVTEINGGTAKIAFVHPLAGKTLRFWIKVVSIQKA